MIRQFAKGMITTLSISPNDSVIVIHRGEKRCSTAKRRQLRKHAKMERSRCLKSKNDDAPIAGDDEGTSDPPSEKYHTKTLAMAAPRTKFENPWGDITGGIFLGEHAHLYDMWKVRRICDP